MAEEKKTRREKSKNDQNVDQAGKKDVKEFKTVRPDGYVPRLYKTYLEKVVPEMMKNHNFTNRLQVPKINKIVINIGCGEGSRDIKVLDAAVKELGQITGQRPVITRAKKSIANFKIREEMPIGCMVTLRGIRMYEFLDRTINITFPRIKDFRGVSHKSFDGRGNYTMGLKEQVIFPEINMDHIVRSQGMNITISMSGTSDELSKELLKGLGFPFSL
jgi:large subunit ribosomal protein L5